MLPLRELLDQWFAERTPTEEGAVLEHGAMTP
jgi:hypothetical protein